MANRALQAKFERSKRQAREAAWMEYSKADYNLPAASLPSIEGHKITKIINVTRKRRDYKPEPIRNAPAYDAWANDSNTYIIRNGKRI